MGDLITHAALVNNYDRTIALTGSSGMGKSTLGAALRCFDWSLLGDDITAISIGKSAPTAYAFSHRLRLYPDSARAAGGDDVKNMGIDNAGKHVFKLPEVYDPKPLDAIFLLANASEGTVSTNQLGPADACLAIVANSFAHDPNDLEEASRRFGLAADLACRVPVYRLSYPRDFDLIPRVAAAINDTLGGVKKAEEA